ncbi:MAG: hypothetical protein EBS49_00915 [Verrucomicrobia bacterium]|nr:hypothetical protein [Verrucomicrobiota bacterium]NBU68188.1 hypothetical protein [Verrucomicrobiota bacterium]
MAVGTSITVSGLVVTNATITGTVDQTITESGTENTVPPVKEAYNARHELSLEGIDDGYSTATTAISALGASFQVTSVERRRTLGDVAKVSIRGIYYPDLS